MSFTNYLEEKVLQHVFATPAYTPPTGRYVALFTAAPGEPGGGTEVTGGAYVRQAATFTVDPAYEIAPNVFIMAAYTNADVEFPTATAEWGVITHVALFDAPTGGNMLVYAQLAAARTITVGDIFRIPVENLIFSLD